MSDGSSSVAMAVIPSVGTICTPSTVDTTVVAGMYHIAIYISTARYVATIPESSLH